MSDQVPPGSRFYAIIESGRMECPRCSLILSWGNGQGGPDHRFWNPVGSVLTCSRCLARYQLGVLAWPLHTGGGGRAMPQDQIPTVRQLAELRQRAGGVWVRSSAAPEGATVKGRKDRPRKGRQQSDPVNRYVAEGCTCAPLPWREGCAVHGQIGVEPTPKPEVDGEEEDDNSLTPP